MKIIQLCVGAVATNCYIIFDEDTREGAIIDPGAEGARILKVVAVEALNIRYILLTHAHFDHILAVNEIKEATGAQLVLNKKDAWLLQKENMGQFSGIACDYIEPSVDLWADEGTQVDFGGLTARYMSTPGHTPGSCVIAIGECLFTGDTLFRHECGRCDFEGGNFEQMLNSLARISQLDGDYKILPGHEGLSTLADERVNNPYIQQALAR